MKKYSVVTLGFVALFLLGTGCTSTAINTNSSTTNINTAAVQTVAVTVTIDMGNASPVRTFQQNVPTGTMALAALQQVGTAHNIPIVTKHYDFGDMVTGINGVAATGATFWTFLVNGKEASVGAGTYQVKGGDTVGFRFGSGG